MSVFILFFSVTWAHDRMLLADLKETVSFAGLLRGRQACAYLIRRSPLAKQVWLFASRLTSCCHATHPPFSR